MGPPAASRGRSRSQRGRHHVWDAQELCVGSEVLDTFFSFLIQSLGVVVTLPCRLGAEFRPFGSGVENPLTGKYCAGLGPPPTDVILGGRLPGRADVPLGRSFPRRYRGHFATVENGADTAVVYFVDAVLSSGLQ